MSNANELTQEMTEGAKDALKTVIEQAKLLVTLASGFVLAPPAVLSFLRKPDGSSLPHIPWRGFVWAEFFLLLSVLTGYVVLGAVAGSQHAAQYDAYRPATRLWSLAQLLLYLAGIVVFLFTTKCLLN